MRHERGGSQRRWKQHTRRMMFPIRLSLLRCETCVEIVQRREQTVAGLEKQRLCGWATWSLLVPGPVLVAGVQLSAGQEVALWGSVLFALYWAEVGPSVKQVAQSARAKVHVLSLDCDAFNIPSLGGEKR